MSHVNWWRTVVHDCFTRCKKILLQSVKKAVIALQKPAFYGYEFVSQRIFSGKRSVSLFDSRHPFPVEMSACLESKVTSAAAQSASLQETEANAIQAVFAASHPINAFFLDAPQRY